MCRLAYALRCATLLVSPLLMLSLGIPSAAAQGVTIYAQPVQVVRVNVQLEKGELLYFQEATGQLLEQVGRGRYLFQSMTAGTFYVSVLALEQPQTGDEDASPTASERRRITVVVGGEGPSPPTPVPPDPNPNPNPNPIPVPPNPQPLPDTKFGLTKNVAEWVKTVDPSARPVAGALATNFEGIASAIASGVLKDVPSITQATYDKNIATQGGNGSPMHLAWTPFFNQKLLPRLSELNQTGKMVSVGDHRQAWLEIAAGLRAGAQ